MLHRIVCRLLVVAVLLSLLPCHVLAVNLSAESAVLIEQRTGRVLYESNAEEERLIASITKIMTAVVALRYGKLNEEYTVTAGDMAEGSSMYLQVGETLTLEELLYGLMLASGNDAALAVAHCVSGEENRFVLLMNRMAEELDMTESSFANPNGLDAEGHYSTAMDMAKLTAYALQNPTFLRIASTDSVTVNGRILSNHNKLLRICSGCIGVKTGFTKAAGRTLVSATERNGMTLIAVTLKDSDDWNDHIALYDYGFQTYHLKTLATAGQKIASAVVTGGAKRSVMLAVSDDISYPVSEDEKLTLKIEIPAFVEAPVCSGQIIGKAYACLNGKQVSSVDLVAMDSVSQVMSGQEESFFCRLLH